jgi:hypothetical protein
MGLFICLQKENGSQLDGVADACNILHRLIPREEKNILSGIDWYGDTIFNGQQMKQFIPAWKELLPLTSSEEEKELLSTIQRLAERCANGIHLYLKFVGD